MKYKVIVLFFFSYNTKLRIFPAQLKKPLKVPEGEEEEQKIENLFEQIMENFPDLAKEIDFREVQEAQRVPKKLDPRRNTTRHIIITLPKIKRKDLHPRLLYPAKLSFRMEGKIKCFSDKVKLKKFISTKPLL